MNVPLDHTHSRPRAKSFLASLLATAMLGLGLVGTMQAQPAMAAPADVPFPDLQAALVNGASTVLDGVGNSCVLASPGTGTSSDLVDYGTTAFLGHGYPTRDDQKLICPATFQQDTQSAIGFRPLAPATAPPCMPFLLGRVEHDNNVIWSGGVVATTYLSGGLRISIGTEGEWSGADWIAVVVKAGKSGNGGVINENEIFDDITPALRCRTRLAKRSRT